jgi:hypothetical protein
MSELTTMDGTAKQRVRAALLAHAEQALHDLTAHVGEVRAAATADRTDTYAADDVSQADEAGDLASLFEQSEAHRKAAVRQIEALDFAPTDVVAPGAVVGFDGARFVVGVVAEAFDCDGVTYEGISADSPVYARVAGLRVGDEFSFNGASYRIEFVA